MKFKKLGLVMGFIIVGPFRPTFQNLSPGTSPDSEWYIRRPGIDDLPTVCTHQNQKSLEFYSECTKNIISVKSAPHFKYLLHYHASDTSLVC